MVSSVVQKPLAMYRKFGDRREVAITLRQHGRRGGIAHHRHLEAPLEQLAQMRLDTQVGRLPARII